MSNADGSKLIIPKAHPRPIIPPYGTPRKCRVFICEEQKHNIEAAKAFGEIVLMHATGRNSIYSKQFRDSDIIKFCKDNEFNPLMDFLLVGGRALILSLTVAKMVQEYKTIRLLAFDAIGNKYVVIPV
jgi:hypothetical protein